VRIYRRVGPISSATVRRLLTTGLPEAPAGTDPSTLPWVLRPAAVPADNRLILSTSKWQADQHGGTLDSMFPPNGFGMQHPILVWLILLELLGLIGFPFVFVMLGRLIDRGYVAGKTIALLALGYLVWIAVNAGLANYERGVIVLALIAIAAVSAALAWFRRQQMLAFIRQRWRYVLAGEVVFLAGFALFIMLRMWYPDLGHQFSPVSPTNVGQGRMGEKQMELAFLNAIVRSRVFPPYDPFFAHGFINYYYYGFYLVGTLCKLTQIVPATGFNLAIATFFGLFASAVFSAGLNLTRRIAPGILAALLVGVVGNLAGAWQAIQDLMSVAQIHSSFPFFGGVVDTLSGIREAVFAHAPLPPFDYWGPTRIVPGGDITEFPYFTYLFADLHPHLMAYPMTVAALLFAINLARGGFADMGSRLLGLLGAGILVGAIAVTNPWDFPTYLVVIALGALVSAFVARRRFSIAVLVRPAGWIAGIGALTLILYLPFKQSYQTVFATGLGLVRDITPDILQPGVCPSPQKVCPAQVHDALVTPLNVYLQHFGLLLFAALSFLCFSLYVDLGIGRRLHRLTTTLQFALYYRDRLPDVRRATRVARVLLRRREQSVVDMPVLWALVIVVLALALLQYFLLAFLVAALSLVTLVITERAGRLSPSQLLVLGMMTVGLLLSLVTQLVFVKDWLAGGPAFRMNTIFKFYDQIWVLFAIGGACGLYYLMDRRIPRRLEGRAPSRAARGALSRRPAGGTAQFTGNAGRSSGKVLLRRSVEAISNLGGRGLLRRPAYVANGHDSWDTSRVCAGDPYQAWSERTRLALNPSLMFSSPAADTSRGQQPPAQVPNTMRDVRSGELMPQRRRPLQRPLALATAFPIWTLCLVLLLAGSLVYTYAGTVARETVRQNWLPENSVPLTLDGMAFMKVAYPNEYRAINWMNATIRGAPVIAEAGGAYYDWRSRVSMFTGLPSIINGIHEAEQRYSDEIDPTALCSGSRDQGACLAHVHSRPDDLNTLYDSPSPADAWRVIHRYDVRYIFVGFVERMCNRQVGQCYSPTGLAKFDRMVGHGLRVAYRNPGVTIYQVTQA
jgi:uncharacterized membrane protein